MFCNIDKKEVNMKKRLAGILAAVAMMATGAASMGCFWFISDEPKALKSFND